MDGRGVSQRIVILVLMATGMAMSWAAAAPTIRDIRTSSGPDGTRVVLELSEPAEHKMFTLDKPDRVVLDLSQAQIQTAGALPQSDGLVKSIRIGKYGKSDLRVVFDLQGPVQVRAFPVAAAGDIGPRLVLDLAPAGAALPPLPNAVANAAATPAPTPALPSAAPTEEQDPPAVKSAAVKPKEVVQNATDLIIAIDAGHGGEDPGAIGRRGSQEKNVTLAIARQLKELIDAEPGMRAVLTRDGDYFLPLRERINRARKNQANMFISVHADSVPDRSVSGSSVYVLSSRGASSEAARYLADRENAADLIGGVSLNDKNNLLASVLLDLQQGVTMGASADAASQVIKHLDRIGNVHHTAVQQAGFVVLKSPDVPSMLVETAFISNPSEEAKLINPGHQERLAAAIFAGVKDYFYANPPPGTRVAQIKAARQAGSATAKSPIATVY